MQPASQRRRDLGIIAEIHHMHDDRFIEASPWALASPFRSPLVSITFPSVKSKTPCETNDHRRLIHVSLFKLSARRDADPQVRRE